MKLDKQAVLEKIKDLKFFKEVTIIGKVAPETKTVKNLESFDKVSELVAAQVYDELYKFANTASDVILRDVLRMFIVAAKNGDTLNATEHRFRASSTSKANRGKPSKSFLTEGETLVTKLIVAMVEANQPVTVLKVSDLLDKNENTVATQWRNVALKLNISSKMSEVNKAVEVIQTQARERDDFYAPGVDL